MVEDYLHFKDLNFWYFRRNCIWSSVLYYLCCSSTCSVHGMHGIKWLILWMCLIWIFTASIIITILIKISCAYQHQISLITLDAAATFYLIWVESKQELWGLVWMDVTFKYFSIHHCCDYALTSHFNKIDTPA